MLGLPKRIVSEVYAKSKEGIWFKSAFEDYSIALYWQRRTVNKDGKMYVLDHAGNVVFECALSEYRFSEPMAFAGRLQIGDEFVSFCGGDDFQIFTVAVMRHIAYMAALGYGDEPGDVIGYWGDLRNPGRPYIGEGAYKFLYGYGEFEGFEGLVCDVYMEDSILKGRVSVKEKDFILSLDSDKSLKAFIISTIPV